RPAIDENLSADLLRDHLPIHFDRSAVRRGNPALQIEPRRVLGGVAVAAPPQDCAALDEIVEPCFPDLARRDLSAGPVILERPDEGEGPGDIVVSDDEWAVQPLVNIVLDRTELAHDPLVRPPLERSAKVYANELAEHGGVSALAIVGRKSRHRAPK